MRSVYFFLLNLLQAQRQSAKPRKKIAMKLGKNDLAKILELAFVFIVSSAMLLYGIGKQVQFDAAADVDKTLSQLTGMELMWAFYGYSKGFALLLGLFEITGAVLLLFPKTRIVGCLLLTSILMNVILQDVFYGVNVGALMAAMLYQTMTFLILWINREPLLAGIKAISQVKLSDGHRQNKLILGLWAFLLAILFKFLEVLATH